MKRSKRYKSVKEKIEKDKKYSVDEAVKLLIENANAKFDESVEVHFRTNIDSKQADQLIRGSVVLPYGIGKEKKIAVFAEGEKAEEAKEAGADIIGGEELVAKIKQTKQVDFDVSVATPDMMRKLAVIAKVLGPKGLMPSPKTDTVTVDIKKTVEQLKKGKLNFKNDDSGNIHQLVGKVSFGDEKLRENIKSFIQAIKEARPSGAKGEFIKTITVTSTMGAGIRIGL
ncbi:MAG: 50S ribosomal protein L1 [Candidatus Andersenbacteria bacterium]|nr:50S ribosomal protein L1 [Candidatus Andersenbacteria bacterium]